MRVEPTKAAIGARVHVERSELADDAVARRCLELLDERGVLVFPQIGLSDEEQLAFTDKIGTRVDYFGRGSNPDGAEDGIYKVSLDESVHIRPEVVQATFFWHMDGLTTDMA